MAPASIASKFIEVKSKELDGSGNPAWKFKVLSAPSSQTYEFTTLQKFENLIVGKKGKSDGYTYYHGYIPASEVKLKKFPLDANPRKPSPTPITKKMQVTLQKHPKNFHHWNNGMTIICKAVTKVGGGKNRYKIEFGPPIDKHGDGICNGGHTYYSIEQSNLPLASNQLVRVELVILPTLSTKDREDTIKDIAAKRNDNNELDDKTLAHYSGLYDKFIDHLGTDSHRVRWYGGDPETTKNPMGAEKLISLMTALDPYWFPHHLTNTVGPPKGGFHMGAARNPGSRHKAWTKEASKPMSEKNLNHMVPLVRDVLGLVDCINHSLLNDSYKGITKKWKKSNIWQYLKNEGGEKNDLYFHPDSDLSKKKFKKGYKFSYNFSAMIAGAFRHNVWIGNDAKVGGIKYVGWYTEPLSLWDGSTPMKVPYVTKLWEVAKTVKAPSFGNAFLQSPGAYSIQIADLLHGLYGHPTDGPQMIYDTGSSDKWEKESDASKITHYLDVSKMWNSKSGTSPFPPLVEMKTGIPPGTETGYRKL